MNDSFDPLKLDNRVSLNRTRFATHEVIESDLRGRQAWEVLSSKAMRAVVLERASSLHIEEAELERADPLALLEQRLDADDWKIGAVARSIAERFGHDL